MEELFGIIERTGAGSRSRIFTVVDGECIGEKALFAEGELIWESHRNGFFSVHREQAGFVETCGLMKMDRDLVFCDRIGGETKVVICGGGHVSIPVIMTGKMLGWNVTVLEDRPLFADRARRAGADQVICQPFDEGLDQICGDENTYFVVLTRGHRYDQVCLEKILTKEHAYIGMIGSRRRSALVRQHLQEKGFDRSLLESVASPIGLDIGAETPEEIGVAIAAEIIERKNRTVRTFGYPRELVKAITDVTQFPGPKVLVTIVSRKGSAPRQTGAKMLVCSDGRTVGTIGGGCMEAQVVNTALYMLREPEGRRCRLLRADLQNADAEEEGMVCGGTVDVFLEIL